MKRTPSRSSEFLTNLSTLMLVLGIGFGLFIVVGAFFGFGPGGEDVAVHTVVDADRIGDLPPDTVAPDEIEVAVRVRDASAEQQRWFAVRDLPAVFIVIGALWLLRGLLRSVRDGDPFVEMNVKRLRGLALIVLIGVPAAEFLRSVFAGELAASAGLAGPSVQLGIPGTALLGGLAILVLSEVFAEGVRLRDELEGTI